MISWLPPCGNDEAMNRQPTVYVCLFVQCSTVCNPSSRPGNEAVSTLVPKLSVGSFLKEYPLSNEALLEFCIVETESKGHAN